MRNDPVELLEVANETAQREAPGLIVITEIGDIGAEYKLAIFDPDNGEMLAELKYRARNLRDEQDARGMGIDAARLARERLCQRGDFPPLERA